MRTMGIDYGAKRIGIALSDEEGVMAFPKTAIKNEPKTLGILLEMIKNEEVRLVVIGESKNFKGHDNSIMNDVRKLRDSFEEVGISVVLEPEYMTSQQARRDQGDHDLIDASAAAIILQSYLDKVKK